MSISKKVDVEGALKFSINLEEKIEKFFEVFAWF
jgi:hypothetical protein